MPRAKPPPTLDRLRGLLDGAAVHRVLIPLDAPAQTAQQIADALSVSVHSVVTALLAEAEGDRLAVLVSGDARVDLIQLAATVGARRVRLLGAGERGKEPEPVTPLVTGFPTVIDRAVLRHQYVYGATGDVLWVIKIDPAGLRRATSAIVGDIVRTAAAPRSPGLRGPAEAAGEPDPV